jgi:RNA-directed DNA polymerase
VHCSSQLPAQWKLKAIGKRVEVCGLKLNLQKSAVVYCKDSRRYVHAHKQFTFLGYTFRPSLQTEKRALGGGHISNSSSDHSA